MRARCSVRRPVPSAPALAGLLLAAALALTGCGGAGDSGGSASDKAAGSGAQRGVSATGNGGSGYGGSGASGARATAPPKVMASQIVRTASVTVEVEDVGKALAAARAAAVEAGGYVGDENTSRDAEGHERTRVVLRVPSGKYDEVLAGVQGTGRLVERSAKAEDVTGQVVDVDSRIRSQRASVARVRGLMDKAGSLADVVALESELSRREADLEALLAQQASLKDRTSLATITLSLSVTPAPGTKDADDGGPGFLDALAGGWHVFVTVVRWIALALGAVLPFAAAAALLTVAWLRLVRPRLPRRAAPAAAAAMTALGPLGPVGPATGSATGTGTRTGSGIAPGTGTGTATTTGIATGTGTGTGTEGSGEASGDGSR
ncbi:DUF4349 domain-containing protein [Streptomyces sp. NRRL S-340]|uniref:DUF4349 domain-containing protein n=1 Tax=Streptomyces sp. NRRL S-340 TaxID=1463901 RepID=UPI00099C913C|nr:DUF4349 domain-containing protein [Streptomyces sp. NRRL S-340]